MKEIWTFIYLFFFFKLVSMFSFVPRPDAIAILQWIAPEVPVVSTREDEGLKAYHSIWMLNTNKPLERLVKRNWSIWQVISSKN